MTKYSIFTLLITLLSTSILSEYRVFQYYVKSRNPISINQKSYVVTSTLNPVSYLAYHGGAVSIQVDLLRTWSCKGFTGQKALCKPPLNVEELTKNAVKGVN